MLKTCSGCYHWVTQDESGLCYGCRAGGNQPLWGAHETAKPKNKYTRHVKGASIDVYDVLRAWDVTCPAIQHAVKKLLAPGQRGHKDRITDLREALASVQRGIEMEEGK